MTESTGSTESCQHVQYRCSRQHVCTGPSHAWLSVAAKPWPSHSANHELAAHHTTSIAPQLHAAEACSALAMATPSSVTLANRAGARLPGGRHRIDRRGTRPRLGDLRRRAGRLFSGRGPAPVFHRPRAVAGQLRGAPACAPVVGTAKSDGWSHVPAIAIAIARSWIQNADGGPALQDNGRQYTGHPAPRKRPQRGCLTEVWGALSRISAAIAWACRPSP